MDREQAKSDREFERQALYNQYVAYSKAAARMLWVLIAVAVYLGYALLDRHAEYLQTVARWKELSLRRQLVITKVSRVLSCPAAQDLGELSWLGGFSHGFEKLSARFPAMEGGGLANTELRFDTDYTTPILGIRLSSNVFVAVGLGMLVLLTIAYWSYLRAARRSLRDFRRFAGKRLAFLHPWLYNLPLRSILLKAVWQVALEIIPILALAGVVVGVEWSVGGSPWSSPGVAIVVLGFTLLHSRMFDVAVAETFRDMDLLPSLYLTAFGAIAILIWLSVLTPVSLGYRLGIFSVYATLLGWTFWFDLVLQKRLFFGILTLLPLLVLRSLIYVLTKSGRIRLKNEWVGSALLLLQGPKLGGYVHYIRRRYDEFKDLERGSEPPSNPLLPNRQ